MFGYTFIKTSELDHLNDKYTIVVKDSDMRAQRHYAIERTLRLEVDSAKRVIIDLEEEVLKYKTLYLEEVEKRLAMVKAFKEAEV